MELDSLEKYVSITRLPVGVEVMFAGQPCLMVTQSGMGGYSWSINPIFAKLSYGANMFTDIPSCLKEFPTMQDAIAGGFETLSDLGAFANEVDLPDDTNAFGKEYSFDETQNLPIKVVTVKLNNIAMQEGCETNNYPLIKTQFGSHSVKKTALTEANLAPLLDLDPSESVNKKMHEKTAPLNKKDLSKDELSALREYSDESYDINNMQHERKKGVDTSDDEYDLQNELSKHIDSALDKHKTNAKMTVYTGIGYSPAKHFKRAANGKLQKKVVVHHPSYISTSSKPSEAHFFSDEDSHKNDAEFGIEPGEHRHMLKISVPAGSNFTSLKSISKSPDEDEFLGHRGHNFEFGEMPEKHGNSYIWPVKLVSHTPDKLAK